jgi:tetratricopeptide (TPR) repeat protein
MGDAPANDPAAQTVDRLYEGYSQRTRTLVAIRCGTPGGVEEAVSALSAAAPVFGWRPLRISEQSLPDPLGFVMSESSAQGPAVIAYRFPADAKGDLPPGLVALVQAKLAPYLDLPTLMVLVVTMREMKALNTSLPDLWRARTALVAWPDLTGPSQYLPATTGGGGVAPKAQGNVVRPHQGEVRAPEASEVARPGSGPMARPEGGPVEARPAAPVARPALGPMEQPEGGPVEARPAAQVAPPRPPADPKAARTSLSDPFQAAMQEAAQGGSGEKKASLWVGAPFEVDDPNIPGYYKTTAPPAGCRWGKDLAPDDPEGAELIDRCRQLLAAAGYEEVLTLLTKAAKRFRELGNWRACGECYVLLGKAAEARLHWREAQDWYEQALDLSENIDDLPALGDVHTVLGTMAFIRGELRAASEHFGRALLVSERLEDEFRLAATYHRLGIVAEQVGRCDDSLVLYSKAAEIEETHGDRAAYARSLNHQARVNRLLNELDEAAHLLQKSLDIREELEDETGLATGYHELGNLRLTQQDMAAAFDAYRCALRLELAHQDVYGVAVTQAQLGLVHLRRHEYQDAAEALLIAREIFQRVGSPHAKVIGPALKEPQDMIDALQFRTLEVTAKAYTDDLLAGKLKPQG